ncbi:hypothetical protein CEUSTIGMA_g9882.t1 [Chlamydomonas eustigma]|uniref:Uncharacterized protein n=1 Tax=Chlamydomonas eustigma TaxID=1157962 RepID=A0A250XH97_9CHLO|nr:hypothetical protein CEUSTIGMA_g9882.t1 [Chlamydomonas eustigma]|eukprot:GAX82455.1 hypothetical protein CEUSTIGMA_g9882.t1 [Chlamydomonas eustigma]
MWWWTPFLMFFDILLLLIYLGDFRVGGVGSGIFTFFLFLGIWLFLCLLGTRTKQPGYMYFWASFMFAVALLTLFLSPVGSPMTPPKGYDQTIIPMTVVMVSICLGIVVAGMGMLFLQVFPAFYARPLRYDVDVLGQ